MPPDNKELLWEQYNLLTDLYKFYLELIVQANLLIFAIIGGIATYMFANPTSPLVRWSLILPIGLSVFFAVAAIVSVRLAVELKDEIVQLKKKLNLGLAPHVGVLVYSLFVLGGTHLLLAIFLALVLINFEQMMKYGMQ
jgi:hypothetical protein